MFDSLRVLFDWANGWLQFAERKNAVMLAGATAASIAVARSISLESNLVLLLYLVEATVLFGVAALASLYSFLPQLKLHAIAPRNDMTNDSNIFFFDHMAKYDARNYLRALSVGLGSEPEVGPPRPWTRAEQDLANQVIVLARIASKKYSMFTFAAWCIAFGVLTPVLAGPWYFVRTRNAGLKEVD